MAYEVYLDDMLLPIPPQKIPIKYSGQNKTATLIDGNEITLTRPVGLAEITLDFVLPQMDYPAAVWGEEAEDAETFITRLQDLMERGAPFEFIVLRDTPGGSFDTNLEVVLEDYKVSDDVTEGFDLAVSVTLKEYRHYGTRVVQMALLNKQEETGAAVQETREGSPPAVSTYTVIKGDCLWNIAKKHLGNGSRWQEIYHLNRDKVTNPNRIYPGQVLVLP